MCSLQLLYGYCICMYAGSVIRCIRRLAELLRQMCQAAKAIGNTELENKFSQGGEDLKNASAFCGFLWDGQFSWRFPSLQVF